MGPINYFSPVVYKGPNTDFWAPWMDTTTPRAGVKLSNGEFQPDPICTGFDESWMPYFDIRTRYSSLEEIRRYKRGFEP